MKTALVLLAQGFEEVEALTPVDYLRRAGIDAKTVSVAGPLAVSGARGIVVSADLPFDRRPAEFDCLILPGGMPGTKNLATHEGTVALVQESVAAGRLVGAICAAPALVLGLAAGVLGGKAYTCHPDLEEERGFGGLFKPERVVRDGNIITSRAAGTAGEFALALIEALAGGDAASKIAKAVMAPFGSPS